MSDCVDIDLVANAGVLVRGVGLGLLVDGMHDQDGHPFSRVEADDMDRMARAEGIFNRLDYLLFTHEHPDHFTPELVSEHVKRRPVRGVFLPAPTEKPEGRADLLRTLEEQGVPHWTMGPEPGDTVSVSPEPGLTVTAIGTRHMGEQFRHMRNDCLLVTLGGMNLLFTGDADHVPEYYEKALKGVALDAAFVNPIFYHNPDGQGIIDDIFSPMELVIYHMPKQGRDPYHLAFTVKRAMQRYARPDMPVHVLDAAAPHVNICRSGL
ncbi:MBL fold metallo-hydrolase [uncultured Pseudodesulfovibrio sp.]|uniref:MBL fold metallo-hydrolase n=1 Tax=uncultured Pseudodesulfovibrio sp. TaxID=2035858 RepID=UPI0029C990E0|nr:MBL fold metallo-hydrolase [uncultured Pseudodesulfovibrio sp.]